jgi:ubiquinone/menaquinone biosynthesis C-methylase UbiE
MAENMHPDIEEAPSYTLMTADVYDAIYAAKDYKAEAAALKQLIDTYKKSEGNELLDVACGTGLHLPYLIDDFQVTGIDLSAQQIEAARKRLPDNTFIQGDMREFNLRRQFDVVTCLFSSIGYVYPYEDMKKAVKNMTSHLKPGGVLFIEPWLQPDVFDPNRPPHTQVGELPEKHLKVTRTMSSGIEGNISILNAHIMAETPNGTHEFSEQHRLALYTTDEFRSAFLEAGLAFRYDEQGLSERGLYIGIKQLA